MKHGTMAAAALLLVAMLAGEARSQGSADVATGFAAGNHFIVTGSGDLWFFGQAPAPAAQWYGRATAGSPSSPVVGAFYVMTGGGHRFFAVLRNGDVHAFGDGWVFDNARLIGNIFRGASTQNIAAAFYSGSYGSAYAVAQDGDVWRWNVEEAVFNPQYSGNVFGATPTTIEPTTWGRMKGSYRR